MLFAPGSRCAELEEMQKWVTLTQLELRKLISERAPCKNSGLHGTQPLLYLRWKSKETCMSTHIVWLEFPKKQIKIKDSSANSLFRGWSRKYHSGSEESETRRQFVKGESSSQSPLWAKELNPARDFYVPVLKPLACPRVNHNQGFGAVAFIHSSFSDWSRAAPRVFIPQKFQSVPPLGRADSSNQNS